jgi:glycosyltransferase involved in cell wall biosynthesis
MREKKLRIIVPCYNEEERLDTEAFKNFFSSPFGRKTDFLFVNDGSKDKTIEVIGKLEQAYENVSVLDLKKNGGKAEAIRQGMLSSTELEYDYIGFFDADLATPLNEIERLFQFSNTDPYLIMGARIKLLGSTNIKRKLSRHYIGRIFATIVSNMLRLPIYDTQCGAKLIKQEIVAKVFKERFLSKWLFDVEVLFRIKQHFKDFETKTIEVPLKRWEDKDGSKIKSSYFLKAPFELLRIYWHYK